MEPTGLQVHPRALAEVLGVNLDAAEVTPEAKTKTKGQGVIKARVATEKFDVDTYPEVMAAVDKHSGDRSADTHRIVDTCFRAGLRFPDRKIPQGEWVGEAPGGACGAGSCCAGADWDQAAGSSVTR